MKNLIMHKEGENSFITYIKKRIKHNLNFVCLFQGASGIGKTWSAISMAEQIDPEFDTERQVTFDFKETMTLINNEWFKQKKWKIIIFDEPQISISNRTWQSLANRMMNYLLSTFRHQNVILIFCSPYKDFLDSQSVKMIHCIFECMGVDKKKGLSKVRPKLQQYNSSMKKTYQHRLYVISQRKIRPMTEWFINKPSKESIDIYERRKTEFTSKLNKDIQKSLDDISSDKKKKENEEVKIDTRKPLTDKQEQVMKLLTNHKAIEVAKMLNITTAVVSRHKKSAIKKGYRPKEFKEEGN